MAGASSNDMTRSNGRILTTHAGSLPRPKALTELYARRARGEQIDEAELHELAAQATRNVLAKQIESGIDIPNNGEQGREGFFLYLQRRMSGFGGSAPRKPWGDLVGYPEFAEASGLAFAARTNVNSRAPAAAIGEVRHVAPELNQAEIEELKAAFDDVGLGAADLFMTAPSPGIIAAAMENQFYEDDDAYLDALAEALRVEYESAVRNGLILQIDAPDLAMERHVKYQDEPLDVFLKFVDRVVHHINMMLDNVPKERVRMHVCWGNYEGPHVCDVALREVLPALLRTNVGGLMIEFANPRHAHEMNVLKDLPIGKDQYLVAGVIDTVTNIVEHPELIAQRLERAAECVGDPSRVLAGTDCGFDTVAGMGRVTPDVVWAKLRSMREGAEIASRRLF